MKALVYHPDGRVVLERDWLEPQPGSGEALVRVRIASICNTDLEISRGYKGYHGVLGHEFVGEVAAVRDGEGSEAWLGQRVVGEINIACGYCPRCLADMPTHCANRRVLGILGQAGSLAEYLTLPLVNLQRVPAAMTDEQAVFTEPLAAACQILAQVEIDAAQRVAVLGDGKLGQLCAQVLALTDCKLVVIGRHKEKLALLKRRGIEVLTANRAASLRDLDVVVEATGSAAGFAAAMAMLRPRGTLVLKSTYAGTLDADMSELVVNEITLVGSRCGPFPAALSLLKQGRVDVAPLISATYPIDEAEAAFARAQERGTLKVLVDMR